MSLPQGSNSPRECQHLPPGGTDNPSNGRLVFLYYIYMYIYSPHSALEGPKFWLSEESCFYAVKHYVYTMNTMYIYLKQLWKSWIFAKSQDWKLAHLNYINSKGWQISPWNFFFVFEDFVTHKRSPRTFSQNHNK